MIAVLWLVNPSPPFSLIRPIYTAANIDRLLALDEPGRLSFTVSPVEGQAMTDVMTGTPSNMSNGLYLPPDLLREGAFVVDFSTEKIASTLWYIQNIAFGANEATVTAIELRGLFEDRTLPQGSSFVGRGAAGIVSTLLAQVNGRNPTWVLPGSISAFTYILPVGARTNFSGQSLKSGLDALAQFSNCDWWIDYHVSRQRIRPCLQFGTRGQDLRGSVHLTEGAELRNISYSRDAREVPRFVRFVESAAGAAGGVATGSQLGYRTGGQVQEATQFHIRRARRRHGAALSAEQLRVYPQQTADIALVAAALNSLQTSEVAIQTIELVHRVSPERFKTDAGSYLIQPMPFTPWASFGLGDIITVRLTSPHFLAGVDVVVRVIGLQPDEASGEMAIVADIIE